MTPAASCWSVRDGYAAYTGADANASTMARIQPGTIAAANQIARRSWSMRARTGGASSSAPQYTSAGATKQTCSKTCTASLRTAASYRTGTCQTAIAADCTASATGGRIKNAPLCLNAADRESAPATARRAESGNGSHNRGHGRPRTTSGGTTVMRTTCCDMCAASQWSAQPSNGGSSTTNATATPL